ncbi:hypothetical protein MHU86_21634 [Fragilaria crotonensis]|nr:hypothetical protein MHU86_21634 [Fragilaria crotonensis]
MENVLDSISGMLFSEKEGNRSSALDLTTTTTSTDDSQDDREISYSTSGGDSSTYLPSPPRIAKYHSSSMVSSVFTPIHRPAPFSLSRSIDDSTNAHSENGHESFASGTSGNTISFAESSSFIESAGGSEDFSRQSSEISGEVALRSTPMARMRSNAVAQAAKVDQDTFVSPPRKAHIDPEKTMAEKHRKWRRQIKEAKRLKDEDNKNAQVDSTFCVSASNMLLGRRNEPTRFFERFTSLQCGTIDDVLSVDFPDDFSEGSSGSEMIPAASSLPIGKPLPERRRQISPPPKHDRVAKEEVVVADDAESENNSSLQSTKSLSSHLDMEDANFVKAFIRETSQEGYPLIWHMPSSDHTDFDNQIDIVAFLELGFLQEDGSFAGPRLAWYNASGNALGAIDLLDIHSLVRASALQLNDFPFAIPGNSMILKLQNSSNILVLEASSPKAARRFIHGLRWVVARLAFNLIVGNKYVSCELLELRDSEHEVRSSDMNKAMNDVTKQLIDKATYATPQQLV